MVSVDVKAPCLLYFRYIFRTDDGLSVGSLILIIFAAPGANSMTGCLCGSSSFLSACVILVGFFHGLTVSTECAGPLRDFPLKLVEGVTEPRPFKKCNYNVVVALHFSLSYELSRSVRIEEITSWRSEEATPEGSSSLSSSNRCTSCHVSRFVDSNSTIASRATVFALSLVLCDVSVGCVLRYNAHMMKVLLEASMFSHEFCICEQSWKTSETAAPWWLWGLPSGGGGLGDRSGRSAVSAGALCCCSSSSFGHNSGNKNQNPELNRCYAFGYQNSA